MSTYREPAPRGDVVPPAAETDPTGTGIAPASGPPGAYPGTTPGPRPTPAPPPAPTPVPHPGPPPRLAGAAAAGPPRPRGRPHTCGITSAATNSR
ncbi:hypothetical protein [Micromonospora deserti]|uniref:hypothetical protein n=1 Tax=Micromonospora deserti TaxID=2070366 RepID=UPI0018F4302F|nr:hypothetical protein [Micromonospora deserti]